MVEVHHHGDFLSYPGKNRVETFKTFKEASDYATGRASISYGDYVVKGTKFDRDGSQVETTITTHPDHGTPVLLMTLKAVYGQ